jgi:hypothetical protein
MKRADAKHAAHRCVVEDAAWFLHEPVGAVNGLNVDDNQQKGWRSFGSEDRTCDEDQDYGGHVSLLVGVLGV